MTVVAHSQGAWVAAAGLDGAPADQRRRVAAFALLGAFPRHAGGYELDGPGAGAVDTDALEALTAGLGAVDATSFEPDGPLARALLGRPGRSNGS
ncbi:MAG TPA: hypothetical protein VIL48_04970 [Acidimicrobiales bacterium]